MSHIHTLKDLEIELSFIKDKKLLVTCRDIENGKQLVFRDINEPSIFYEPKAELYIHNDLRTPSEKDCYC